jgi:Subtilase family
MECFYPGRVLVGPGIESGGPRGLAEFLTGEFGGDFEFEFGIEEILAHHELKIPDSHAARTLPFVGRVPEGAEIEMAQHLARFSRHRVAAATPDYLVRPNAPITVDQHVLDQTINTLRAWPRSIRCGDGCTVGILDSGIDPQFVSSPASLHTRQYDSLAPSSGGTALSDTIGHGSLVARIINTLAPGAKLISIKTFDQTGTISSVIAGLYLANAAGPCDVLNLSLSVSCAPDSCAVCGTPVAASTNVGQLGYFFRNFMQGARNCVLVAAAGNNVSHLTLPAAFDEVIAVGSFDYGTKLPISLYKHVPSTRYVLAPGGQNSSGRAFASRAGFSKSQYFYGTSFATAFITGFAAKSVCSWKNGPNCGTRLQAHLVPGAGASLFSTILGEIDARADKAWTGFSSSLHGLGAIYF